MTKRSHQLSGRYEKDQLGCMWGLISMFDFRHDRTTHRLLQDGRNGRRDGTGNAGRSAITKNGMLAAAENGHGKLDEGQAIDRSRSSVKKLMEEEMLVEKAGDNEKCNSGRETKQQSTGKGDKKQKQKKKKGRSKSLDNTYDLDAAGAVGSAGAFHHQSHKPSSNSVDNDITMEELCNNICQRSMDCLKHGDQGEIYLQGSHGTLDFEEKLGEAVKFLVSQKLTDESSLTEDGELKTSKEVMEALQILSSDEELFLKLLRDPNSLVVRYVPDLHDAQLKKDEDFNSFSGSKYSEQKLDNLARSNEIGRRRKYHFFRRKPKANAREAFRENKDLHTSKKIVILKPGPAITRNLETGSSPVQALRSQTSEANGEVGSEILLSEIKSKLKRAMGKYHRRTYSDGQFPDERRNVVDDEVVKGRFGMSLPTKNHFSTEKVCAHPSDTKEEETSKRPQNSRIGVDRTSSDVSNQKVANIYIEAKKHLSDLLSSGLGDVGASSRQSPKTLGKILALPDFNMSPASSPGRNGFMTAKMRFASLGEFQKVDEDMQNKHESNLSPTAEKSESQTCTSDDGTNSIIETNDMNILVECINDNLVEEASSLVGHKMTMEDTSRTTEKTEATVKEESNCLESMSEPSSCSSINKDDGDVSEIEVLEENSDFECPKQNCCPMDQHPVSPVTSPSKSPVSKLVEYAESSDDIQGRPSPISVLEPLFSDDETSPSTTRSRSAETSLRPMKMQFDGCDSSVSRESHHSKTCSDDKKIVLDYVMAVLEVSDLSWEELCIVSFSSDQPLDPSLLEEVELPTNHLCPDQKLLFDCINEALMDLCIHYSAYAPWVSFVEPNVRPIQTVGNICQEVFQEVCWHLQPIPLPHTLEQIVRKDMYKMGRWLDLRHDADSIGAEIGAVILEDLMEDSMVSFMDASDQDDGACVFLNRVEETWSRIYRDESSTRDVQAVNSECNKEDGIGVGEC